MGQAGYFLAEEGFVAGGLEVELGVFDNGSGVQAQDFEVFGEGALGGYLFDNVEQF